VNRSIVRSWRVLALRWSFRLIFGLPRLVRRLLAGPPVRLDGQMLDMDLQLLGRVGALLESRDGGTLDQSVLAEQRRQADFAAEIAAAPGLDDIVTEDLTLPGPAGLLSARLYVPPSAPVPSGLLVYYHGGGFVLGSLASTDPLCRLLAAQSGLRLLSVEYRLAPEHPYAAALEDAIASYRAARKHAAELGADPDLVAVGGDSAGANLALVVAHQETSAHESSAGPAFVLALYPVTDAERTGGSRELFGTGFGLTMQTIAALERLYLPDGVPPDDTRGAILRADDLSGMPPVYLSTAGFDPLRDEGEELAARLRADGVPVVARRFAGLVHGYASFTAVSAAARDATLDAASALRAALALVAARTSTRARPSAAAG
jgi:acetyl esterase/lipase